MTTEKTPRETRRKIYKQLPKEQREACEVLNTYAGKLHRLICNEHENFFSTTKYENARIQINIACNLLNPILDPRIRLIDSSVPYQNRTPEEKNLNLMILGTQNVDQPFKKEKDIIDDAVPTNQIPERIHRAFAALQNANASLQKEINTEKPSSASTWHPSSPKLTTALGVTGVLLQIAIVPAAIIAGVYLGPLAAILLLVGVLLAWGSIASGIEKLARFLHTRPTPKQRACNEVSKVIENKFEECRQRYTAFNAEQKRAAEWQDATATDLTTTYSSPTGMGGLSHRGDAHQQTTSSSATTPLLASHPETL